MIGKETAAQKKARKRKELMEHVAASDADRERRRIKAGTPPMGKPKERSTRSLWSRWFESHGDRFESENEARIHFQEKVCTHDNMRYISTKNRPGGERIHIHSCTCGKMIEKKVLSSA